jgi:hypothetical protein
MQQHFDLIPHGMVQLGRDRRTAIDRLVRPLPKAIEGVQHVIISVMEVSKWLCLGDCEPC